MSLEKALDFRKRALDFWFSNNRWSSLDKPPAKSTPLGELDALNWFSPTKEFDQQVRDNFEDDLPCLLNDEHRYPNDLSQPEHLLACIIALDQFPRHIYRKDARAFSFDHKARELGQLLINHQGDKQLPYVERTFIYLPFEHSENLDDQDKCVKYFKDLYEDAKNDSKTNESLLNFLKQSVKDSEQHRDIIKKFGRFPHRNEVLKRQAFESEDIYLRDGGERFGQ
jgi:uncharacterized protein (DUF924 family)